MQAKQFFFKSPRFVFCRFCGIVGTLSYSPLNDIFLKQTYSGIDIIVLSSTGIREMSYWFYRKEKSGKKDLYAVDFPYVAILPLLGMLAALLFPRYLNLNNLVKDCFYLISAGFFLLLISKLSLFSKRIWNSWGLKHMSKPFRFLYITGYILIGTGVVIVLILSCALLNR